MALRLIIEDDEGTTTVVPLGADAITIGRQQGNTIQLTEKNVSRRHARLFPEEEGWFIEDLGSYNGVKVNGSAVEGRLEFKEGDVVQIGDYSLALSDNVDKSTLNFAAGQGAANDGGEPSVEEPMLASSSTDLPRISNDELVAMQSGPVPVTPMMESGAVPAVAAGGFEEEKRSNTGLLIGLGAVVVGALILTFAWMARSGNEEKPKPAEVATQEAKGKPKVEPTTMAGVADVEPEPAPTPTPTPGEVAVEPEPEPEAEVVIDDDTPEPAPAATKPRPRTTKKKSKPSPSTAKKTPPPAPAPSVDTKQLLADARKASLKEPAKCYDLAKKAYNANRSTAATEQMAKCACKMGDAGKAKKAAGRLRGEKKAKVAKLCELKGINL
ncbi:MAG: FHA domain-containing protein [Myxococcota bacterium]